MQNNVTQNQLIKFVYGELSFEETATLYDAIDHDFEKLKDLEVYANLKFELNKIILKPNSDLELKILKYSAEF